MGTISDHRARSTRDSGGSRIGRRASWPTISQSDSPRGCSEARPWECGSRAISHARSQSRYCFSACQMRRPCRGRRDGGGSRRGRRSREMSGSMICGDAARAAARGARCGRRRRPPPRCECVTKMKVFFSLRDERQQVLLEFPPRLLVDGGERLVHEQHVGVDGERARQADALAHAAGKLVRILLLEAGEADLARYSGARSPRARPSPTPRSSSPKATLRITVAQGISAKSWNTKARSGPGPGDGPAVRPALRRRSPAAGRR